MLIKINENKPAFIKIINSLKERAGEKTASGAVMYAILSHETQRLEVMAQYDEITRLRRENEALKGKVETVRQSIQIISSF